MIVGIVATALSPEAPPPEDGPRTLALAVWAPLRSSSRHAAHGGHSRSWPSCPLQTGRHHGDGTPTFYLDLGFSLTDIASVAKFAALGAAIIGGLKGER